MYLVNIDNEFYASAVSRQTAIEIAKAAAERCIKDKLCFKKIQVLNVRDVTTLNNMGDNSFIEQDAEENCVLHTIKV